jgi:hypothetical protein
MLYRHLDSPRVFQPNRASGNAPDNLKGVNALRSEKFQSKRKRAVERLLIDKVPAAPRVSAPAREGVVSGQALRGGPIDDGEAVGLGCGFVVIWAGRLAGHVKQAAKRPGRARPGRRPGRFYFGGTT